MDMNLGHHQRSFLYLCPSFYVLHDAMRMVNWYTSGGVSCSLDTKTINKKISLAFIIPESLKWKITTIFFSLSIKTPEELTPSFFSGQ